jgi:hypothetical protein
MEIKRRRKKETGIKLKRRKKTEPSLSIRKRPPKKRYTKSGVFIIQDKPDSERYVPCIICYHFWRSPTLYISPDKVEGRICSECNEPRLKTDKVICKHFNDEWVSVRQKITLGKVDDSVRKLTVKRRRRKER